jgi:hypothetical protein
MHAHLARVLLVGASELAIQDAVHWFASAWVPHVLFASPNEQPTSLARSTLAELDRQLPAESQLRLEQLADCIADATDARIVLANAHRWCEQAVAALSGHPKFAAFQGLESRCIRDLTIVVRTIGCFMGSGYGDTAARVRSFAAAHLLPFLRDETRIFGTELVAFLDDQMGELSAQGRTRMRELLASVYRDGVAP